MSLSRRGLLALGAISTTAVLAGGLSACGSNAGASGGGGDLRFTWWGNDVRNRVTSQAIETYQTANEGVTISPEPGEWASYWDRLATQTAARDTPDIIQMDDKYIREYGDRGVLMDLGEAGVDVTQFAEGAADAGYVQGKLLGVNAGSNTPVLALNPALLEKLGLERPDDMTWTWDEFRAWAASATAAGNGVFGASSPFNDATFGAWLRQSGKDIFSDDGLGFEAADVVPYYEMMIAFATDKAIPQASVVQEDGTKPLGQTLFATGNSAIAYTWSNQVKAFDEATGEDLVMLRLPSIAGDAKERKAWYKAGQFFSASAQSENPEAAAAFVSWLVNSPEAGNILLTERGLTPNSMVLEAITPKLDPSDQKVADFMEAIRPELSETPPLPVVGGGTLADVLGRNGTEVLFGRLTPQAAADAFIGEVSGNISR